MQRQNNVYLFECPVCHKKFKIEFAFKGHLRLTMDEAHVAFRQANTMKEEKKMQSASLQTTLTGTKLLDQLEALVEDQEKKNTIQDEQDACFNRIKDFVVRERENDTKQREEDFQAGYDYKTREYEDQLPDMQRQIKEDVRAALIIEIEAKYENQLNEIKNDHERNIGLLIRDIKNKTIHIACPWCDLPVLVEKNSQVHFEISRIMSRERLGHPECVKRNLPDLAHYWDWKYYADYQRFHSSKQS